MEKKIKFQGLDLHYSIYGSGEAIMFIHGFTETSDVWKYFVEAFKDRYLVITPDLPAHGKSGFVENLSIEFMADCINAITLEENLQRILFVGHSMGGYVALNFAKRFPDMIAGLCLFHSTALADNEEQKKNRDRAIEIVKNNRFDFLKNFIPDLFAEQNRTVFETQINNLIEIASDMKPEGIIACLEAMKNREENIDYLVTSERPIGFIIGKKDSRLPFETLVAQTALPKISYSLILGNCGHMGHIEDLLHTVSFIAHFAVISFK